jgi:hypothetical protein
VCLCQFISIASGLFPFFFLLIIYLILNTCMVNPVCYARFVTSSVVSATLTVNINGKYERRRKKW